MSRADQLIAYCASWAEFFERATALPTRAAKGEAFERLVAVYLTTAPEYRSKLSAVWPLASVPDELRRQLNLPRRDEGIDLIAQTHGGEFWAVQCKFRSERDRPLTRSDLATFTSLAFVTCRGISLALVAHTSAKPVGKRELMGPMVEIGLDEWISLDLEAWRLIRDGLSGEPPKPIQRLPRPHQEAAIEAARAHFVAGAASHGRLIMPCGTGKSLTAFWIAEALEARSILVAVPSLALIRQSLRDWTREFLACGRVSEWLCVCSDESVGALEQDDFVGHTFDLGIPTTTSVEEIATFLQRPLAGPRIIFTTYQSSARAAEGARAAGVTFDLAILDEAHKTVGAKSKAFATLLHDKNIGAHRRLFMTATERVLHGDNDDVLSMDDERVYGRRFFQLSFKAAIHQRIICDYKILTVLVTDTRIAELVEENCLIALDGGAADEAEAQALAAGIALNRVFREHDIRHAISFHRSILAADQFRKQQDILRSLPGIETEASNLHISSRISAGERADLLDQFSRHERALITNARCLTEGIDIPAVDCVLFADPKQSVVDIVQAAGRVLRRYEGKDYGFIVLPLVVPPGLDLDVFAESTAFRKVAQTIMALSTQDERIAEEFRVVERGGRLSGKIVEIEGDVPVGLKLELGEFAEAIRAQIWERVGRANWRPFNEARAFARSLGLKTADGWSKFAKAGRLPADIPADPRGVYKDEGWAGMGDWLGTGFVAHQLRQYRRFKEARVFARSQGLRSEEEWRAFAKSGQLPTDIPANPGMVYKGEGWAGMGDWLGTGFVAHRLRQHRHFEEARAFARSLGLRSGKDWGEFAKSRRLPADIPADPRGVYKDEGWAGMGDWLGTGAVAPKLRQYRPFEEARAFARSLELRTQKDWREFTKSGQLPTDIPANPGVVYKGEGWAGMGDWLGTGFVAPSLRQYRRFKEARTFAHSQGLRSEKGWREFVRSGQLPADIPANPSEVYKDEGWAGMGDWLGTGAVAPKLRQYRPFEEARAFARSLELRTQKDWREFTKSGRLPADIPANPRGVYKDEGWAGIGDWLGTGFVAHQLRQHRHFEEARAFARSLGLKTQKDWREFAKSSHLPADIPADPRGVYRGKGWAGYGDWLGTRTVTASSRAT